MFHVLFILLLRFWNPFRIKDFYIYIFILICYVISFSLWFTLGLQQSGILVLKVCIDMARDWKQTTMTKRFIKQKNRNKIHWIENLRKLIETEMEKKNLLKLRYNGLIHIICFNHFAFFRLLRWVCCCLFFFSFSYLIFQHFQTFQFKTLFFFFSFSILTFYFSFHS